MCIKTVVYDTPIGGDQPEILKFENTTDFQARFVAKPSTANYVLL